jgi:hypothetical protein
MSRGDTVNNCTVCVMQPEKKLQRMVQATNMKAQKKHIKLCTSGSKGTRQDLQYVYVEESTTLFISKDANAKILDTL